MEEGQKKKNNKWLVVVLCALVVLIVGLVIGIAVVRMNEDKNVESEYNSEEVDEIISKWQEEIDSAQTNEEKYNAYMNVAIDLDKIISDKEGKERSLYCEVLLEYVGKASEFVENEDDTILMKAMRSDCAAEEENMDFQVEISGEEE